MFTAANVTVMVKDLDMAIEFYRDVLGLALTNRYQNHWAEIRGPDLLIGLHPAGDKKIENSGNLSIGFGTMTFDQDVLMLEEKGIRLEVKDAELSRMAYFKDPDGTPLYVREMKVSESEM
ncbi:MAG: VOC family protein [Patescibacteria group bacterium]|jgi:catechol 2,3-dioxygenase-like lactoylglutathione lyase family enzyme